MATEQQTLPPRRVIFTRVMAHNVRGVDDITLDLGLVTVIEATNGSGKSSLLAGFRCCLGIDRTSLANLAKITDKATGARAEDVEMVVWGQTDDGLEVRVSRKGSAGPKVEIKDGEDWKEQPKPVEWLRAFVDPDGANPQRLLTLKQDELATVVLEAMPLPEYSRAEALKLAGHEKAPAGLHFPPNVHPLDEIALIEAHVTETRRATGNKRDEERSKHATLMKDLPADQPEKPAEELARVSAQRDELHQEVAAALSAVESRLQARKDKIASQHAIKLAELRAEHDRAMAAIAEEARQAVTAAQGEAETQAAEVKAQQDDLAAYDQRLAALRERDKGWESDRRVRGLADTAKLEAATYATRYEEMTEALRSLNRYKVKLVEKLPIRGLDVRLDEKGRKLLLYKGVPWDEVNESGRLTVCGEIASLRTQPPENGRAFAPLILIDRAEGLDETTRKRVAQSIADRGGQVIMAVAADVGWRTLRDVEATQ